MLATLGGLLALLLGLAILLLPLLATELSRPRDSVWGAVVLLMGLVLVTSADRLTGAPMLGVLCGGLLIGRLAAEVSQGRWRQLSPEEQQRLWSAERWQTSLQQAGQALAHLIAAGRTATTGLGAWLAERRQPKTTTKRWVRQDAPPEEPTAAPADAGAAMDAGDASIAGDASDAGVATDATAEDAAEPDQAQPEEPLETPSEQAPVVSSFAEIEALMEAAAPQEPASPQAG